MDVSQFMLFFSLYQMVPLHMAAARGRYEVVGCLVKKGAKNDMIDNKGVGI